MTTTIISIDVEADHTNPLSGSMLQLGAVADSGAEFSVNIRPRHGAIEDPDTAKWLKEQKDAEGVSLYDSVRIDAASPGDAMAKFSDWLKQFARIKFVAMPAAYDWMWLKSYYEAFGRPGRKPLPFKAECISTMRTVADLQKKVDDVWEWEKQFFTEGTKHVAVDDARNQLRLYQGLLKLLG